MSRSQWLFIFHQNRWLHTAILVQNQTLHYSSNVHFKSNVTDYVKWHFTFTAFWLPTAENYEPYNKSGFLSRLQISHLTVLKLAAGIQSASYSVGVQREPSVSSYSAFRLKAFRLSSTDYETLYPLLLNTEISANEILLTYAQHSPLTFRAVY